MVFIAIRVSRLNALRFGFGLRSVFVQASSLHALQSVSHLAAFQ